MSSMLWGLVIGGVSGLIVGWIVLPRPAWVDRLMNKTPA